MKSIFTALVLALTLLQVHPAFAAGLAGLLQAEQAEGNGVDYNPTNIQWLTNSSTAATLSDGVALDHLQEMTSASYGNLSLAFNLDEDELSPPPGPDSGYSGYAGLEASWSDTITISNAALDGTQGYLRPTLLYSCNMSASCDSDSDASLSQINFFLTGSSGSDFGITTSPQLLSAYATNSPQTADLSLDNAGLGAFAGAGHLDIPFIYGQPFDFSFELTLNTDGGLATDADGKGSYAVLNHHGTMKLQWQGAQVLDANSNVVSGFALTSDSGTDWAVSQAGDGGGLQITGIQVANGTNLVINGANGTPSNQVFLLGSTNVALPMTNWVRLDTNAFDFTGNVSFTHAVTAPQYYFRLMSN